MPFIELPTFQNTTGQSIGAALSGVGHDYEQTQLEQNRFNQLRQNALQDQQTAQTNRLQDLGVEHQNRLDEGKAQTQNQIDLNDAQNKALIQRAALDILVSHGYISPQDLADPVKVSAAFQQSQKDGLYQRYHDMLTSVDPKTGKPFLTPQEMSDPAAVDRAFTAFGQTSANQGMLGYQSAQDAKSAATQAQLRLQQVHQSGTELNQKLTALMAQAQPTDLEVRAQALLQAQAQPGMKVGQVPSVPEVQAQMETARQTLTSAKMQQIAAIRAPLDEQRRIQQEDERSAAAVVADYARKGIYPDNSQLTTPASDDPTDTPAMPAPPNPQALGNGPLRTLAKPTVPAPSLATNPLADPTGNDPIIAQANSERASQADSQRQQAIMSPILSLTQQLQDVNTQLAQPTQPGVNLGAGYGAISSPMGPTLQEAGTQRSALLQRQAAIQNQLRAALAAAQPGQGQPATGAAAVTPSLSDFNGSTPAPAAGAMPDMISLYGTPSLSGS